MATITQKQDQRPRPIPAGVGPKSFVRWGSLLKFLMHLFPGSKLSLDSIDGMEFPGGAHLRSKPGRSGLPPFTVTVVGDGDGLAIQVEPGTYLNDWPQMGDGGPTLDTTDPVPTLPLISSGTYYVVLNVEYTFDDTSNDYVVHVTFDRSYITMESSNPGTPGLFSASGRFAVVIAKIVDGVVTAQPVQNSFSGFVDDDGTGTITGYLQLEPLYVPPP